MLIFQTLGVGRGGKVRLEITDQRSGHARQSQLVRQVVFVLIELLIDIGGKGGMDFVDLKLKIDYRNLKLPYLLLHARRVGVVAREHREDLENRYCHRILATVSNGFRIPVSMVPARLRSVCRLAHQQWTDWPEIDN